MQQEKRGAAEGIDDWTGAILSDSGPALAMTRYVLLALAEQMRRDGSPTTRVVMEEFAARSGLSRPTVMNHLRAASAAGWLTRGRPRGFGRAWASYEFTAVLPTFHGELGSKAALPARTVAV